MKVLIIRLSAIGDIVLTTPIVRAVKQQIPHCELHFLVKSKHKNVLESSEHIDVLHLYGEDSNSFLPQLKEENFDYIIDLQKNFKSKRLCKQLGAPSFTFPKLNIKKWILVNLKINKLPNIHIVDRYFMAVTKLGVTNDLLGLEFPISPNLPSPFSAEETLLLQDGYFTIALGSLHKTKQIPTSLLLQLIPKLSKPIVLLGGPDVALEAEEIMTSVKHPVINMCGKCSLQASALAMKNSLALVTGDTGLMHIAAALQINIVSLWGNTVPEFGMYPYIPQHPERSFIFEIKNLKCRPCSKLGFKKCPKKHFNCMNLINPNEIALSMTSIINESSRTSCGMPQLENNDNN